MMCYWRDPGAFLSSPADLCPKPFTPVATEKAITPDGWFKTGDLACVDDEGFVYIKDRGEPASHWRVLSLKNGVSDRVVFIPIS